MDYSEYIACEDDFLKKVNKIYISQKEINVLEKYGIDINKFYNVEELLYNIETYLNNVGSFEDLEWVSDKIAEYNYYANTNK